MSRYRVSLITDHSTMALHGQTPLQIITQGCPSDSSKKDGNSAVSFEKALTLTGFGRFHWLLVLVTGLAYLSSGYQNNLTAYVIPAAQCDLRMSSEDKGLLNAVFLIGGISSAFLWGILADHVGRHKILVSSLFIDAFTTFLSSFSQSFGVFAVFRFINGFVIGAPGSIVITYLSEFIGVKQRARCVCLMGFFFTISWLLLPGIAMIILPLPISYENSGFQFHPWHLFTLLATFPSLLAAILLLFLFPESPKFLYSQGREMEALQVMAKMYKANFGSITPFPVETILPDSKEGAPARRSIILDREEVASLSKSLNGKSVEMVIRGVWRQVSSLVKPPNVGATALASILLFCNMFGYCGLGLWLPELFDRFEEHYRTSNESVTVCELTRWTDTSFISFTTDVNTTSKQLDIADQFCQHEQINTAVYINTFIIGSVCLLVNIITSLLADVVGLKFLTVVTTLVSAASALAIYFLKHTTDNLIVSCIFLSMVGAANIIVSTAICDLFPTRIRALAVCAAMFAGRFGAVSSNLIMGYVLDSICEVPVFLMSATLLVGTLLAFLLPGRDTNKISSKL